MTKTTKEIETTGAPIAQSIGESGAGFPFSAAETYDMLALRAFQYTAGESASLPEQTARELLSGLRFGALCGAAGLGRACTMEEAAREGISEIRRRVKRARLLLESARRRLPPLTSAPYRETLDAVVAFFGNYDEVYFPHAIPCDIDYPLCRGIDETLEGVDYITSYLRALNLECDLLRRFGREETRALYERAFDGFEELVFNLYTPVAEAAIGRTLLMMSPEKLTLDGGDRKRLVSMLSPLSKMALRLKLSDAASRLCIYLALSPAGEALLRFAALGLCERLEGALGEGDISGIFPAEREKDPFREEVRFVDGGSVMENEALRRFIDEARDCRFTSDKFAMIRREVRSVADLTLIMDAALSVEEREAFMKTLSDAERELLRLYAR